MIARAAFALGLLLADAAAATAPEDSLRPAGRPAGIAAAPGPELEVSTVAGPELMRPQGRPMSEQTLAVAALGTVTLPDVGPGSSLRPSLRPDAIVQQVLFKRRKLRKTSVCGDIDIQGEPVGSVVGSLPGCGAKSAVRVSSVAGVQLSKKSVMTCDMANSLNRWVKRDVEKAFGRRNRVVSLRVAAHYSCRTRNNRPGARISEHGKGKAIDISGFTLEDGETITVLEGWQKRRTRRKLRKIWKAACGPFGTVLGPDADRYHKDHFHLDVARHRGGSYCR
ncbi:extensin family protein [Phaeobacter gallaeciensis]|uniref:extensin-like domain-containing protein n=1 Tax=Phaeobacter gallaeciensis TaxID=60890 RepID=UPI00237F2DB6|nr:extensin family protein [Phaeobacter gallaeciensis]MDE4305323.1 extensin family protein [Phaeobacter gallaeciensis]MDE4309671.1 extensin family protein [Phaeobacter gallaeciensis]MDE4314006.1 extensin family protein [Phaeobacter gallaeciensis]MDE4318600.1 extensin family protein [Phaeobacter gallaeciensis]MDE4322640.1 extensin family protein [Phaeobacter gallaeciensis]